MITDKVFEIEVFRDTINKYNTTYAIETELLKSKNTVVYDTIGEVDFAPKENMKHIIVNDGTVSAGSELVNGSDKVAILNFADAIEPGGLVLVGETTQEENICRCSNLYASLTTAKSYDEYYNINAKAMDGVYTDRIIYSKDVLFFKDDLFYADVSPYFMDVITCPAPCVKIRNKDVEYAVLYSRISNIIKSAILNGVNKIVLGAWGCGAFGQDPSVVSDCFVKVLKRYNAFDEVIFAIRSCRADVSKAYSNYDVFKKRVEKW